MSCGDSTGAFLRFGGDERGGEYVAHADKRASGAIFVLHLARSRKYGVEGDERVDKIGLGSDEYHDTPAGDI